MSVREEFVVLICDKLDQDALDQFQMSSTGHHHQTSGVGGPITVKIEEAYGLDESELVARAGTVDGIVVRSSTKITRAVLEAGTMTDGGKLKVVGRAGIGVDNIDIEAATECNVQVVNAPFGNVNAAAELTIGLMLAINRHIASADKSIRDGQWERSKFLGCELKGKRLGLLGLGQVGRRVAALGSAFGMVVQACDPMVPADAAGAFGVEKVDFETFISTSDVISCHVPLVQGTRHAIDKAAFSKMRQNALLINTSRGGVVDERALAEALKSKVIRGAALDVFEVEKAFGPDHHLLADVPNLLLTPHLGASTVEAQKLVGTDVAADIISILMGYKPTSPVNNIPAMNGRPSVWGETKFHTASRISP